MQPVTPSSTDVDVTFRVLDSTTFLPYEGLTSATPGLALWYRKGALGAVTAITEADHTNLTDAHSDGKIKHIDDGLYRLSLPDAAVPTAEHEVTTYGGTATGYVILGGALVGKPVEVVSGSLVAASVSGAVGSVATGGIVAASFGANAVNAAALAADAVAEIQSGLATAASVAALNNLSSADAQAAAAAALTAYDPPTMAELTAGLATADDATLAAIAARPSVADFWSGITATAARFIADHTLRRSWASAAASADGDALSFRSLLGAAAKLVNRVGISGATLTVYREDDLTALGTQTLSSDADAAPVTGANTD